MIKIEKQNVEIIGNSLEVMSEMEMLIRAYIKITASRTSVDFALDVIDKIVKHAKENTIGEKQEEKENDFDKKMEQELYELIKDIAVEIFGGAGDGRE